MFDARIVNVLIYLTTSFLFYFICPLIQYLDYYFCLFYQQTAIIFIYTKLKCNFSLEHSLIFDLILYHCYICTSIYFNHIYFHYNHHFRIFGSLIIWIIFLIYFIINIKILIIPPSLILFMTTPKKIVIFYQSYIFFHLPYFVILIIIL